MWADSSRLCRICCRFKEFVQGRALHELATKDEIAALRPSVQAQAEKDAAEAVKKSAEAAAAYVDRIKAGDADAAKAAETHAAAVQALQAATQAAQATAAAAQQASAGAMHPGSPQDAITAAREAAETAATAAADVGSKASQEATAKAAADAAAAAVAELRANAPPGTDALMRGEALPQTAPQVRLLMYVSVLPTGARTQSSSFFKAILCFVISVARACGLLLAFCIKNSCQADIAACLQLHITDDMLKAAWAAMREQAAARSKEGVAVIKPFESGIRRPYFHVKELDSAQLVVWSRYLDFAERSGAHDQVVKLYERCLVACAGYPGKFCLRAGSTICRLSLLASVFDRPCMVLTPCFILCRLLQTMVGGHRPCGSCSLCKRLLTDPPSASWWHAAAIWGMPSLWCPALGDHALLMTTHAPVLSCCQTMALLTLLFTTIRAERSVCRQSFGSAMFGTLLLATTPPQRWVPCSAPRRCIAGPSLRCTCSRRASRSSTATSPPHARASSLSQTRLPQATSG